MSIFNLPFWQWCWTALPECLFKRLSKQSEYFHFWTFVSSEYKRVLHGGAGVRVDNRGHLSYSQESWTRRILPPKDAEVLNEFNKIETMLILFSLQGGHCRQVEESITEWIYWERQESRTVCRRQGEGQGKGIQENKVTDQISYNIHHFL